MSNTIILRGDCNEEFEVTQDQWNDVLELARKCPHKWKPSHPVHPNGVKAANWKDEYLEPYGQYVECDDASRIADAIEFAIPNPDDSEWDISTTYPYNLFANRLDKSLLEYLARFCRRSQGFNICEE